MKMLNQVTRVGVIQVWFGAVILSIVGDIAFGADMSLQTAVLLFALGLVPPAIALRLWPAAAPPAV